VAELSSAEQRVLAAVDESWVVDLLRRLVAVPSVGGTFPTLLALRTAGIR
jgi:acetylornithine deacetylase